MNFGTISRAGFVIASVGMLTACGGSDAGVAKSNPQAFAFDFEGEKLIGTYNSAGFNADEVRQLLALNCKGGSLAGYGEQPGEGGLVSFTATCKGGPVSEAGGVQVSRSGNQVSLEGIIADENGDVAYRRVEKTL